MKAIIPLFVICLFTFQLFAQDMDHLSNNIDNAVDSGLHYLRTGLLLGGLLLLLVGVYLAFFRRNYSNGLLVSVIGLCVLLGFGVMYMKSTDDAESGQKDHPEVFIIGTPR